MQPTPTDSTWVLYFRRDSRCRWVELARGTIEDCELAMSEGGSGDYLRLGADEGDPNEKRKQAPRRATR